MDRKEIISNGKLPSGFISNTSSGEGALTNKNNTEIMFSINLNWLVHILYVRQEYKSCKELIEMQLNNGYKSEDDEREYLYYIKGLIAKDEKDYIEAFKYLQKSIEINPNNPDVYREMGKTSYALGRWKQSLEIFLKAEKLLLRTDGEIYYYIGELLYRNIGQPKAGINEAKEYFHRAIQNGRRIDSFQKLSEIYKTENNYPKAIEMLESSLQIAPQNIDNLADIGILYLKVNDTKSAFDKLLDVTKLNGKCSKAFMALGAILQSKNDVDGALNKYKYVENDIQDGAEIWSNIGLCFFKKKKYIAAMACLKKAIWMSPLNFNCLYNIGLIYLMAKQYASAFQSFAAAISLRPESAESFMMFGICLTHLNDHENALVAFERSVLLSDAIKNPLIYLNHAIYCWQMNKIESSQLYLGNFLKMSEHMSIRYDYIKTGEKLKQALPEFEMVENTISKNVENSDEEKVIMDTKERIMGEEQATVIVHKEDCVKNQENTQQSQSPEQHEKPHKKEQEQQQQQIEPLYDEITVDTINN